MCGLYWFFNLFFDVVVYVVLCELFVFELFFFGLVCIIDVEWLVWLLLLLYEY